MKHEALPDEVHVGIESDADIVTARQVGRTLGARIGCSDIELTEIATAISELARNIMNHAGTGSMAVLVVARADRSGIRIVATDTGPGIADIDEAMQDGFTTGGGLGLGLPGTRRLMDDFSLTSEVDRGTTIVAHKWTAGRRP